MSESRPKGTRNIADDRMYDVTTHPISTAFMLKSLPIEGSTIFVDDTMNGVRNALIADEISATLLNELSVCINSLLIPEISYKPAESIYSILKPDDKW